MPHMLARDDHEDKDDSKDIDGAEDDNVSPDHVFWA